MTNFVRLIWCKCTCINNKKQDFPVILNKLLQNYWKIWKKCFLRTTYVLICLALSNIKLHICLSSVAKGLTLNIPLYRMQRKHFFEIFWNFEELISQVRNFWNRKKCLLSIPLHFFGQLNFTFLIFFKKLFQFYSNSISSA